MDALKWGLRFILAVLAFLIIGAGIYYGVPYLYHQWIKPMEEQSLQLNDLKVQQEQDQESFSSRLAELQERIQALTLQQDKNKEELTNLNQKITEFYSIKSTQEAIAVQVETINKEKEEYAIQLETMNEQFSSLKTSIQEQQTAISTLSFQSQQQATSIAKREQEVMLLKVAELIAHSRYYFADNNYGLAQNDLQAAKDLLKQYIQREPSYQIQMLTEIDQRLELLTSNIITSPNLVEKDMDVVWQMLMQVLSDNNLESPSTPTPSPIVPTERTTPTPSPIIPTEKAIPTPIATERL